jgi:hypothetical protein
MATKVSDELDTLLEEVREQALSYQEILDPAQRLGLTTEDLRAVLAHDEELWEPCRSELAELARVDTERAAHRKAVGARVAARHPKLGPRLPWTPEEQNERWTGHRDAVPWGEPLRADRDRLHDQRALDLLERETDDALADDPEWQALKERRREVLARLRQTLLERSLLPALRVALNQAFDRVRTREEQRQRYRRPLRPVDTKGLRDEASAATMVRTEAQAELAALLDTKRTPRASIGVAGPRGCGKTTLLRRTYQEWPGRGVRILVQAPASYVPREFLLYLYSRVCEEVLDSDPDTAVRRSSLEPRASQLRAQILLGLVLLPALLLAVGVSLLVASTSAGATPTRARLAAVGGAIALAGAVPFTLLAVRGGGGLLTAGKPDRPSADPKATGQPLPWRLPGPHRLLASAVVGGALVVLAAADLLPWLTLRRSVGAALVVLAAVTAVWWTGPAPKADPSASRRSSGTIRARFASAVRSLLLMATAAAQLVLGIAGVVLLTVPARAAAIDAPLVIGAALAAAAAVALPLGVRWRGELEEELRFAEEPPSDRNSARAWAELNRIRYQRSVMSGWTGSVKLFGGKWLPFGLDTGASGSTTDAETPMVVPEMVEGIKRLLPSRGPAVVAIDELDKLEAVEKARDFLNEIKGVFEAQDSHFLVSMSEDAIASFERRGLPFRDVFDSAFDEVVRVPYLTYAKAHALLNERVTDVAPPFLALAYCQSGGLARDLLRAMERMIFAVAKADPSSDGSLATVAWEVVHRDVSGKTEAVVAAIRSIPVEPEVSAVLRSLQRLDACDPRAAQGTHCLLDDGWLEPVTALEPILDAGQTDDVSDRRTLLRLCIELLGYAYYSRTILELFEVTTDDAVDRLISVVEEDDGQALDLLARSRQTFAVNPWLAWNQVTQFRQGHGLPPFDLPGSLVPVRRSAADQRDGQVVARPTSGASAEP